MGISVVWRSGVRNHFPEMTNGEARMKNVETRTKRSLSSAGRLLFCHSEFVILSSFVIGHSSFAVRGRRLRFGLLERFLGHDDVAGDVDELAIVVARQLLQAAKRL